MDWILTDPKRSKSPSPEQVNRFPTQDCRPCGEDRGAKVFSYNGLR
jgi:hypothetical protein